MGYLAIALTIAYYIVYPILYMLNVLFAILAVLAAPVTYLGHYVFYACWYPIHLLSKFEVRAHGPLTSLLRAEPLIVCTDSLHFPRCGNSHWCGHRNKSPLHIRLHGLRLASNANAGRGARDWKILSEIQARQTVENR